MSNLSNFFLLGVPSLDSFGDYIFGEIGTGIGIVVVVVGLIFWAAGKYGRMITLLIVGALLFFISKGPERVFNAISGLWEMIFGG